MIEIWKKVVLENYANFNGRARRKEYWMFVLTNNIILVLLVFLSLIPYIGMVFSLVMLVFIVGTIVPSIAVAIRRMHDVGKSGWFCLIPYYNLYLCCIN